MPYFSLGMLLIVVALYLSVGIGMLKGLNWARLLYLWMMPVIIIGSFIAQRLPTNKLLVFDINIIIYFVVMIFITRPKVVAYFTQKK